MGYWRIARNVFAIAALVAWMASDAAARAWEQSGPNPRPAIEQLWAEASAAQQHQQYARAAALYRQIVALQPDFTEAQVNLGIMLHLGGKLQDAVSCFDHVLAKHSDLFAPQLLAGLDQLKLDNPRAALPHLQAAVNLSADNKEARAGLANSYLQLKQYPEALEQFTRVAAQNPRFAEAWYGMGATYLSMEKAAEKELRASSSPYRTLLLAQSYLDQGQVEKGTDALKSVALMPQPIECSRTRLGLAYLQQSKFEEAAQQFQQDWDEKTSEGCLLAKLGKVALKSKHGDVPGALDELRSVAAIDPAFAAANSDVYISGLVSAGLETRAREIVNAQKQRSGITETPADARSHGHYSSCTWLLAPNAARLALEDLRSLSYCGFYSGHDEAVMTATEGILKRAPNDPEALYWRIQSMERLGLSAITRASEINPDSASLYVLMGDLQQAKGDLAEAAVSYRRAIALKPGFAAARLGLARSLNSDHKTEDAEKELRSVLESNPNDPEANYLMGEILVNRRALAEALPCLLKALRASSEELPFVHADLSRVYEDQGKTSEAITEMKQALSADVDGSYYYRLGHLYLKAGDHAAANAALASAAKLRQATDAASLFEKTPP